MTEEKLAKGLGLFSIGLGLTQLLAPRWLGRKIGIGDETGLMRALGARETLTGIGVLNPRTQNVGLWGRVAGDVMDLAILGLALRSPGTQKNRTAVATGMVLGVGLLDLAAARMASDQNQYRFQ
ncbi:MAG TPA: hypothetical protein VG477_09330 [Thermoanaerobaculia bacterium]|jgi:hypothetical protein|nr:hypothetical protein [Thermoanaerobaculia bacterium]